MIQPILPGSTVGVLGSGQLGRMFAIAARRMGYRVHTFSPDEDTPTGQVADVEIQASYDDLDAVSDFARHVSVVTFEFENVPAPTAESAARYAPVRPSGSVLHTTQQRIREKSFLTNAGLPTTPYREVYSLDGLKRALADLGCPAVLKTAAFGYDGKGQFRIEPGGDGPGGDGPGGDGPGGDGPGGDAPRGHAPGGDAPGGDAPRGGEPGGDGPGGDGPGDAAPDRAAEAWAAIGKQEAVLEAFIDFDREISVVAARGANGEFVHYGAIENHHSRHILDVSIAPARVPPSVAQEAVDLARCVLERLDVVGVLCVEFFVTRAGELLINELAPRPHNSGHLTVDACFTSQFEQQLRAVCGLPLGSTHMHRPAAMANLLGDLWANGEPDWPAACAFPGVKLHLYGKLDPRPGRKMGHLTALNHDPEEAYRTVLAARAALAGKAPK